MLEAWVDRALNDEQISGIGSSVVKSRGSLLPSGSDDALPTGVVSLNSKKRVAELREKFVSDIMNEIDIQFGRSLGCRISPVLRPFVGRENHVVRKELGLTGKSNKGRKGVRIGAPAFAAAGQEGQGSSSDDVAMSEAPPL